MSKITVLVVEPEKRPYIKEIENTLRSLQIEVGGYIQAVYPWAEEDAVAVICDDEAKLNTKPLNRALRDENGEVYDIIAGTFLIVGLTEDDFGSLREKDIERFSELFRLPEVFMDFDGRIIAMPME